MAYVLAVDLGTTFTAAAVATNATVEVVTLGTRGAAIPSVVALRGDGSFLVGEPAEHRGRAEPDRLAREFKRRLGDPVPLLLGGTPYGPETLQGHVLAHVLEQVTTERAAPPDAVVLTHPASWGDYKLDLLRETARIAGLDDVRFVSEPAGAARHYHASERVELGEIVAVYDLGGGTFDAAVLRRTESGFALLGTPAGLERVGGIDFDQAVLAHVDRAVDGMVSQADAGDPDVVAALANLRDQCRDAKEALSQDTEATVRVFLPNLHTEVRLTRSELEQMIRPRIDETVEALQRVIRSADIDLEDVSRILLVGGSSRIPLVGQQVRERTGRPVALDAHPKFAIVRGAAATTEVGSAAPNRTGTTPSDQEERTPTQPTGEPMVRYPSRSRSQPIDPSVAASPDTPAAPRDLAPAGAGQRTRRTPFLVGAGVLVVVAAVIAVLAISGNDDRDDGGAFPPLGAGHGTVVWVDPEEQLLAATAAEDATPTMLDPALDEISAGEDLYLSPSPNGTWFVAETSRFGCSERTCLARYSRDLTVAETLLIDGSEWHETINVATIADDGALVVFVDGGEVDGVDGFHLWATRRQDDGRWSTPVLLTEDSPFDFHGHPRMSPDATAVVAECGPEPYQAAGTGICEVDTTGGTDVLVRPQDGAVEVEGTADGLLRAPTYLPDGRSIGFSADYGNGEEVYTFDRQQVRPLVRSHATDTEPCVLPDGWIASLWWSDPDNEGSDPSLKVMSPDGLDWFVLGRVEGSERLFLTCSP